MNKSIDPSAAKRLQQYNDSDDAFAAVMAWAAKRKNDSRETNIDRLAYKADLRRSEVVRVAKLLAELGHCKFVPGRHSHPSRIEWISSLRSVGLAATGRTNTIDELDIDTAVEDDDDEQVLVEGHISHVFQLRPDVPIKFDLPANLTQAEAQRLARFVESLPFGD